MLSKPKTPARGPVTTVFRLLLPLILISAASARADERAATSTPAVRFALWVEAEGKTKPFESKLSFERYSIFSSKHFTDLYCQVYRGGRSWFSSNYTDETPYREALTQGLEPLAEAIEAGHRRGQRVHAWLNVLRVDAAAPIVANLGRDAVLIDNGGRSLLDYDERGVPPAGSGSRTGAEEGRLDTAGVWLDPSSPEVRRYLSAMVRELAERYPALDGVHLDMIRYPFINGRRARTPWALGYAAGSLQRFYDSTGMVAPHRAMSLEWKAPPGAVRVASDEQWRDWRRRQLTQLVFEIREALNEVAPQMELSAAVLSSRERAHDHALQDWASWVNGGVLTYIVPMTYTTSMDTLSEEARTAVKLVGQERVIVGLGAWLMIDAPSKLSSQVKAARSVGAAGVSLFSYGNLYSKQGALAIQSVAGSALGAVK